MNALVLEVVKTDNTFSRVEGGWQGRCIFCQGKVFVSVTGTSAATLEHIVPINAGGTNDLLNLGIAHTQCNSEKGIRHDPVYRKSPRAREVIDNMLARRRERWIADT